jgi:8-oxo-dGTP pyrophosphatase MutT (NUDIX family)
MIIRVKNIEFEIMETADPFSEFRNDIEQFWAEHCRKNPEAFSEKILNVLGTEETAQGIKLQIGIANYYEAFYSKNVGNIKTRNLFSGAYILTSDGYYCLAVDTTNEINLIGGVASLEDFDNGRYIPELCLIRECKEEMGIDITDEHFTYELKYLKVTSGNENYFPVGILYEINTSYSKYELETIFKSNPHDNELSSLKFIRLDGCNEPGISTRRKYIIELFDLLRKEL